MINLLKKFSLPAIITAVSTFFVFPYSSQAQNIPSKDTLSLSLQQAEKQFIDSNFLLLAAHYNVDAQKALIQQARLWQNPVLNSDQMIAANGKFVSYTKDASGNFQGQYYVQVQQLIMTARKRGKLIDIATTNAKIAELQLQDVLRNLRYQLHQDYFTLQQQLQLLPIYQNQLNQLNILVNGMQSQLNAGNIAQKDFVRMQALAIALQQDIVDLKKSIADTQNDLKTLLQIKDANLFVKPTEGLSSQTVALPESEESLLNIAKQQNPYFLLQQTQTQLQQQNLNYQKALRVPDVTLGPNFDRNSNFAPNYFGLGISLPLPILNKNQGNIKSAEYNIKQQQAITQNAETELKNNISNAYYKLSVTLQQNNNTQKEFYNKYSNIYTNMLESYKQRQIGLLEFLDFFNDYISSQQRFIQQQLNLVLANEELNYYLGK
ncbi:MAG: TolC family protein [Bacteroidota bacterium]|nr:TolC family protein [Bacteroidota bacterium]